MLKIIKQIKEFLKKFPWFYKKLVKMKRIFFPSKLWGTTFIKTTSGSLQPNPKLYSVWVRKLYNDLHSKHQSTHIKKLNKCQKCLNSALHMQINHQPSIHSKQLFIDISVLIKTDHGTGIQRVVRNTLSEFLHQSIEGYQVEPIYGSEDGLYRYADSDEPIDVFQGDIFLGLDLISGWISRYTKTFSLFKACGAKLYFIIYDLLPVYYPHFFQQDMQLYFTEWLHQITLQADGVICISKTVANELLSWLEKKQPKRLDNFQIGWFHLGADLKSTIDCSIAEKNLLTTFTNKSPTSSILMVSTIEPRKGYNLALAAFELLWQKGEKIKLIIVGRPGWKVNNLIQKLQTHPEKNKHLFWFENINDSTLLELYSTSSGLLMASEGEGFGLALIEAAHHQLPVLVRDIPIFREVAGEHACYFSNDSSPVQLADTIKLWLQDLAEGKAPLSGNIPYLSWTESTQQLIQVIIQNDWYQTWSPRKKFKKKASEPV